MTTNTLETQSALCRRFTDDIHNSEAYIPFAKPGSRAAKICASYAVMFDVELSGPTEYTVGILSPTPDSDPLLSSPAY